MILGVFIDCRIFLVRYPENETDVFLLCVIFIVLWVKSLAKTRIKNNTDSTSSATEVPLNNPERQDK